MFCISTFAAPCTYKFNVTTPSGSGTQIMLERSELGNHIRNVRVMMPGFAESNDLFHPEYLSSIEGFTLLRFMDWGVTNSANMARWYQRSVDNKIVYEYCVTCHLRVSTN
jgi:hypothetical protein